VNFGRPVRVDITVEAAVRTRRQLHLGEEDLLPKQVPSGLRFLKPVEQPAFLVGARQRGSRIEPFDAIGPELVAAWLVGAVLAGVEHVKCGQRAPVHATVQLHVDAVRHRRLTQRHVLVVRL